MSDFKIEEKRQALQTILETVLGSSNVYFQPPVNTKLTYPCIIYHRVSGQTSKADNKVWNFRTQYEVQYITQDPTVFIFEALSDAVPYCAFNRSYIADRLHHNVYTIYI
jgi:hypothetical protein